MFRGRQVALSGEIIRGSVDHPLHNSDRHMESVVWTELLQNQSILTRRTSTTLKILTRTSSTLKMLKTCGLRQLKPILALDIALLIQMIDTPCITWSPAYIGRMCLETNAFL